MVKIWRKESLSRQQWRFLISGPLAWLISTLKAFQVYSIHGLIRAFVAYRTSVTPALWTLDSSVSQTYLSSQSTSWWAIRQMNTTETILLVCEVLSHKPSVSLSSLCGVVEMTARRHTTSNAHSAHVSVASVVMVSKTLPNWSTTSSTWSMKTSIVSE